MCSLPAAHACLQIRHNSQRKSGVPALTATTAFLRVKTNCGSPHPFPSNSLVWCLDAVTGLSSSHCRKDRTRAIRLGHFPSASDLTAQEPFVVVRHAPIAHHVGGQRKNSSLRTQTAKMRAVWWPIAIQLAMHTASCQTRFVGRVQNIRDLRQSFICIVTA